LRPAPSPNTIDHDPEPAVVDALAVLSAHRGVDVPMMVSTATSSPSRVFARLPMPKSRPRSFLEDRPDGWNVNGKSVVGLVGLLARGDVVDFVFGITSG
jgi:hypothetical protein